MFRSGDRKLLRRCAGLVREVDDTVGIPAPFDLDVFLARWARFRGRPIELFPLSAAELPHGLCGLWLELADRDIVGYPESVPPNHRDHIVLHEVGHMAAGHRGSCAPGGGLGSLMPDLDPEMVRAVLGRSVYTDLQEVEAELFASLVVEKTLNAQMPGDAVGERLRRTLDP